MSETSETSPMECRPAQTPDEQAAAYAVRHEVFVVEQGCPPEEEYDEHDPEAQHFVAMREGGVVGTARAYVVDGHLKIGRVAVLRECRGQGVGEALMHAAHRWAGENGFAECVLHAQTPVIGFYEKLGYIAEGEVFYEANIPHRRMVRRIE